jgi:hypothetical protein
VVVWVVVIIVPSVLEHMVVGDCLAVGQGADRVEIDIFVGMGLDRGVGRLGGGGLVLMVAGDIGQGAATVANGVASVKATVWRRLENRRIVDAVAEIAKGRCGGKR